MLKFHLERKLMFSIFLLFSAHKKLSWIDPFFSSFIINSKKVCSFFECEKLDMRTTIAMSLDHRFSLERYPISHSFCCLTNFFFYQQQNSPIHRQACLFLAHSMLTANKKLTNKKILTHTRWEEGEEKNKIWSPRQPSRWQFYYCDWSFFSLYWSQVMI